MDTLKRLQELLKEYKENDSGRVGKASEIVIKELVNSKSKYAHSVTPACIGSDLRMNRKTMQATFEIKTACGELDFMFNKKKIDYVVYAPEVADYLQLGLQFFVIPTNEFKKFALSDNFLLRTKISTNGDKRCSFQSFRAENRPKASKRLSEMIWDFCYNYPCVNEFFDIEMGGAL